MSHGQLKVFAGSAHPALAREIADHLDLPLGSARLRRFPDTEVSFQIDENIRGTDVFVVQPTSAPVDDVSALDLVVIQPSVGVATADAYQWLDEDRRARRAAAIAHAPRAVEVGWPDRLTLQNDLEAPVARRHPVVLEMIEACDRAGACGTAMTGSGSAVFGLFPRRGAARVAPALARRGWRVLVTRTLSRREAARRVSVP